MSVTSWLLFVPAALLLILGVRALLERCEKQRAASRTEERLAKALSIALQFRRTQAGDINHAGMAETRELRFGQRATKRFCPIPVHV